MQKSYFERKAADEQKLRNLFSSEGWRTPDTYCHSFSALPESPGIYAFLAVHIPLAPGEVWTEEIVYVGMSRNLKNRIAGHEVLRIEPEWCMRWFITLDDDIEKLRNEESAYIRRFQPRYNIIGKQQPVYKILAVRP